MSSSRPVAASGKLRARPPPARVASMTAGDFYGNEKSVVVSQADTLSIEFSGSAGTQVLKDGIKVLDLNDVEDIPVYVDGADEIDNGLNMIKGGGGALTREKIVAAVARTFVCICDASKKVERLGRFPLPVEVIPMARAQVSRELIRLGGRPIPREGFVTDNGNLILDVMAWTSATRQAWKSPSTESLESSPAASSPNEERTFCYWRRPRAWSPMVALETKSSCCAARL